MKTILPREAAILKVLVSNSIYLFICLFVYITEASGCLVPHRAGRGHMTTCADWEQSFPPCEIQESNPSHQDWELLRHWPIPWVLLIYTHIHMYIWYMHIYMCVWWICMCIFGEGISYSKAFGHNSDFLWPIY